MIVVTLLTLFFLAWGSFLNVCGHRLMDVWHVHRSACPSCKHTLAWYDTIPLLSFLLLKGRCRYCSTHISWLYPAIEFFTAASMLAGYYFIDDLYYFAFFIFFSALIITIRTDIEHMLISQWVTLALVPFGILFSFLDYLPIVPLNSILGAACGYFLPWAIGKTFYAITKKEGIGEGDFDLLAFVGSFLGVMGAWITLLLGSILGSIIGGLYLFATGNLRRQVPLPFGPFLATGAILYVLLFDYIQELFLIG